MTARQVGDAALSALLVAAAVPTVAAIFGGGGLLPLVLAAVMPAAVGVASIATRSRSPWLRLTADTAAALVIVSLLPAASDGRAALFGLPAGLARLATAAVPLQAAGPELGVVVLAVVAASAGTVELALRSTQRLSLVAPAIVLLAAALLAGAGGPPPPAWDAALVVGVAALLVVRRAQHPLEASVEDPPPPSGEPTVAGVGVTPIARPVGRLIVGYATAAIIAVVLVPIGSRLPGGHARPPYDVRAALHTPQQPVNQLNPLATYAEIYDGPVRPVLTARVRGFDNSRPLSWPLTVLDGFDGFQWFPTAVYRRAGTQLPPGPAVSVGVQRVRADVKLAKPQGYLPAPSRPVRVSVGGLDVSEPDAILAVPAGQRPPLSYQVTSVVPDPTSTQLLAAAIPNPDDGGAPAIPGTIVDEASKLITGAQSNPLARIQRLHDYLTGPPFSRHPPGDSPIGSGDTPITQLLFQTHVGSSVQFAAAFALLARSVGFRTRLVVGYDGEAVEHGTVSYTTRDLDVWPEVYLDGIGWYPVPVDPAVGAGRPTPAPTSPALNKAFQQQKGPPRGSSPSAHPPPPAGRATRPAGGLPAALVVAGAVGASLLVAAASVVGLKAIRRRRQRRGAEPAQRIAGAWEHVLDRLVELRVRVGSSLTTTEVVERVSRHVSDANSERLARLVPVVDAARYDRRFPPSMVEADAIWLAAIAAERAIRRDVSWPARARAGLSVAPLRRH